VTCIFSCDTPGFRRAKRRHSTTFGRCRVAEYHLVYSSESIPQGYSGISRDWKQKGYVTKSLHRTSVFLSLLLCCYACVWTKHTYNCTGNEHLNSMHASCHMRITTESHFDNLSKMISALLCHQVKRNGTVGIQLETY
jgi:hypothetical protein